MRGSCLNTFQPAEHNKGHNKHGKKERIRCKGRLQSSLHKWGYCEINLKTV